MRDEQRYLALRVGRFFRVVGFVGFGLALFALGAAPARAEFVLTSPESPVYSSYGAIAGRKVQLKGTVEVVGNVHSNDRVHLQNGSRVTGNVSASGSVQNQGTVTGTVRSGAPQVALPALLSDAALRALADRIETRSVTLNNATLADVLFVQGDVEIRGTLRGTGTIIATGQIELKEASGQALPPAAERISLISKKDVKLQKGRAFRGAIYAVGDVDVQKDSKLAGILIAGRDLSIDKNTRLDFVRFEPEPPTVRPLAIAAPLGTIVGDRSPLVAIKIDPNVAYDPESLRVEIDGAALSGCRFGLSRISCEPPVLALGSHAIRAELRTTAATLLSDQATFSIVAGSGAPDSTPPTLAILAPTATTYVDPTLLAPIPDVSLSFADGGSGVDLGSLSVKLDGGLDLVVLCDFGAGSAVCKLPLLREGAHRIEATIKDLAGNPAAASVDFAVDEPGEPDVLPPSLSIAEPAAGRVVGTEIVAVSGSVSDDREVSGVLINGAEATVSGGQWSGIAMLMQEGDTAINVDAYDVAGNRTNAEVIVTLDRTPPTVSILGPAAGTVTNEATVVVTGVARDDVRLASVAVAGVSATLDANGSFRAEVPVGAGLRTLSAIATDAGGNTATASVEVRRYAPPKVTLAAASGGLPLTREATLRVAGTVDPPNSTVTLQGVAVAVVGGAFEADVPLVEGMNYIDATSPGPDGTIGTATLVAVRDSRPPRVTVDVPAEGAEVFEPAVSVSGALIDLNAGIRSPGAIAVTVEGVGAEVEGGRYLARNVPLGPGTNVLTIVAADALGNSVTREVTVAYRDVSAEARIERRAGDGQTGTVGTLLPEPLEAAVLDPAGTPVAGVPVVFRVVAGDGSLAAGANSGRAVVSTSGSDGVARASYTLGRSAAAGRNRVEATATGYAGRASYSADARPGPAANVFVDLGNNQMGAVGRPLERALSVVVTDASNNRLTGTPVRFEALEGGGGFSGAPSLDLSTDADGRAEAFWTLGPAAGISSQRARAFLPDGPPSAAAAFVATGLLSGDPAATRIEGIVLDNSDLPVPGALVEIHHSAVPISTVTGPDGRFSLGPVPPGHRALLVDGATSPRPGVWPHLVFDFSIVPGAVHDMGRPVYLVDLDPQNGIDVSETEGGTITIPEVPGFALTVEPGAATFPDGSRSGRLAISIVHGDKVPMVPSGGQQPQFIVTFQPPGVLLDPPARLALPNVDGLAPGETIELYSFDHDQGQFIIVGHATVAEDALTVVSDPGVGIEESGWQGGSNPSPDGDACGDCGPCGRCVGDRCVPKADGNPCDDGKFCTQDDMCQSGTCTGRQRPDFDVSEQALELSPDTLAPITGAIRRLTGGGGCSINGPEISYGVRRKVVNRCCDSEDSYKQEERLTGFGRVRIGAGECVLPGAGYAVGDLFKAGAFIKINAEIVLEAGGAKFDCGGADCMQFIAGTGKVEISGGLIVVLGSPELLKVTGGLRGSGQISYKNRCGTNSLSGMLGPVELYYEAVLVSFLKSSGVQPLTDKAFF